MASCTDAELDREWRDSVEILADILGHRPAVASIPGGAFSTRVAAAARRAGIRVLFTSEPRAGIWTAGGIQCGGRFTIWRGMPPEAATGFVDGRGAWRTRQAALWAAKKLAKRAFGPTYRRIRERALAGSLGNW